MRFLSVFACFFIAAIPMYSSAGIAIATSAQAPLLVGTPLNFVATIANPDPGTYVYQFSVSQGSSPYKVVVDYNHFNSFVWTPSRQEGTYNVQVVARNPTSGDTVSGQLPVSIQSRVTAGNPVITATANPLVALYSAPACPAGSVIYVQFGSGGIVNRTDKRPCVANTSMNFYIAGMRASTVYNMHSVVVTGTQSKAGPASQFTTRAIPAALTFPASFVLTAANAQTATQQSVLLMDYLSLDSANQQVYFFPTATDLSGNVIWYYSALGTAAQQADYSLRPVKGGTIMLNAADPYSTLVRGQIWREIDLAGNTVRETNVSRVSQQLNALGLWGIIDFDHDSTRLPNGHTLVLCTQEKIFPAGTQGSATPVDILGNAVVDLDTNLQVVWSWSGFDHLDINRAPILGELCAPNTAGCPPMTLATYAVDWLHGNSLNYVPATGDILISLRNQDWVARLDYKNGNGSGAVLWEMGLGGSFSINSTDAFPWFTHQHDVEYELGGTTTLSIYDNGDTRHDENPGLIENSRGMVLNVDETNMMVTPILSQDLGVYAGGVGSAQRLDNGDYFFCSGFVNPGPGEFAQHAEFSVSGAESYLLRTNDLTYRSYRMDSLYQLDGPGN